MRLDLAREEFQKAIEMNPNNELAHFEMGNVCLKLRDESQAEKEYKKVLELNPRFFCASLELGKIYYYRKRRADLAIAEFNKVISESPGDWEANYLLGKIYKEHGDYKLAIERLERASEADSNREQIYFELGKAYRDMDMPDLAIKQFEKVLSISNNRENVFIKNKVLNEIEITKKEIVLESKVRAMVAMVINRCNLKCIICNIWKTPWQASDKTMNEIVKLFPYIEDMAWEGGEVLLMKGFGDILEEASRYSHLKQVIFTNGLVFNEKIIEKIIRGKVDIVFSIDGATKETYEHIRKGGKFEHLVRNLSMIKQAKEKSGGYIETYFNSIIMKSNYYELEKLIDFAKEYNFNAVTLTPIRGRFGEENIFENNDIVALEYIKKIIPKITKKAYEYGIILNNWLPGAQQDSCGSESIDKTCGSLGVNSNFPSNNKINNKIICYAPWQRLVIDSEGQVRPFVFCLNKWIGNTDKNSIEEIWNGEAMQEYRKRLLKHEYSGLCQPECISGQVADKIRDIA
jgi:MoaA/NifB/PqqE/SkfB family radical SAM enzyme